MAGLRFTDLLVSPHRVPGFHQPDPRRVSAASPALWRRSSTDDGMAPRWETSHRTRRFTVYENCPLRTPEDRLLFILGCTSKPTHSRWCTGAYSAWSRAKPISGFVLLPALLAALRALGDAPARSLTALAQRLGVSEADAATVVTPQAEKPHLWPPHQPCAHLPLLPMTGPNGASSAPGPSSAGRVLGSRKRITPSKMSCSSMPCSSSSF